MKQSFRKIIVGWLILSMGMLGMPVAALAAPIGTDTLVQIDDRGELLSRVQAAIDSDAVRAELLAHGVSPLEVDARIAALSTEELQSLANQLDELPAGSGLLSVLGIVFVVLLVLELVGVTNVFSKI